MNNTCQCKNRNGVWLLVGLGLGLLVFTVIKNIQNKPKFKPITKLNSAVQSIVQSVGESHVESEDGVLLTRYTNAERWSIKRDKYGMATEVTVHRDAKII